jgi:uncharacterized repeat protein (TIGR01451 family)
MRKLLLGLLATTFIALPAHALTAKQTVEKEVVVRNADGTESASRMPADVVVPGERVVYTVSFTNDDVQPAQNFVMTQPVPEEVTYIEGSAEKPGAELSVSTDGGNSFSPRGAATVLRDGERVRATASDITHLRWKIVTPLAPGGNDSVAYKAVLK